MQSVEVVNELECLIDWIGVTFFEFASPVDVLSYLGFSDSDFSVSRGRNGYKSSLRHNLHNISVLYDGSEDMGFHVDISGSAISFALDAYINSLAELTPWGTYAPEMFDNNSMVEYLRHIVECGKLTRLDLAVDDKGCHYFSLDDVLQVCDSDRLVTKFHGYCLNRSRDFGGEVTGNTVNFGSRNSLAFLRVYDKKLEQNRGGKNPVDFDWIRWELELKKERAQTAAELIISGENIGSVIMGILGNYVRIIERDNENVSRCSVDPLWEKFMEGIKRLKMTVHRVEKTVEQIKGWIVKQCLPSIALVSAYESGDLSFIFRNMTDALFKNSKSKLDMLFSYNPDLKEGFVL